MQKAYDKVAAAIDALQKLTAQSEVDQSQYDALVEQYEQAAHTCEEALKGKGALDADVDALSGAVQDALDAANGVFKTAPSGGSGGGSSDGDSGDSGSGSGAGGTNTPAAPGGNSDLTDIGDADVPLADGVSENAQGEEHAEPKNTDAELVSIGDVDVPPADAVGGRSGAPGAVVTAAVSGEIKGDKDGANARSESQTQTRTQDGGAASETEIADEEVPLAAAPEQPAAVNGGILGAVAAACGAVLVLGKRRKKDESR